MHSFGNCKVFAAIIGKIYRGVNGGEIVAFKETTRNGGFDIIYLEVISGSIKDFAVTFDVKEDFRNGLRR